MNEVYVILHPNALVPGSKAVGDRAVWSRLADVGNEPDPLELAEARGIFMARARAVTGSRIWLLHDGREEILPKIHLPCAALGGEDAVMAVTRELHAPPEKPGSRRPYPSGFGARAFRLAVAMATLEDPTRRESTTGRVLIWLDPALRYEKIREQARRRTAAYFERSLLLGIDPAWGATHGDLAQAEEFAGWNAGPRVVPGAKPQVRFDAFDDPRDDELFI